MPEIDALNLNINQHFKVIKPNFILNFQPAAFLLSFVLLLSENAY